MAEIGEPELEDVTPSSGSAETIGADDGDGRQASARAAAWLRDRVSDPARDRARRHPLATAAVLLLLTGAALASAVQAVPDGPGAPALPPLTVTLDAGPTEDLLWRTDGQGRPSGPPVLPTGVGLIVPAGSPGPLTVTGVVGPGVLRDDGPPPAPATAASVATAALHPVLDCDRLPLPSAAGSGAAYRIRVLVGSGSRQSAGTVPVPAAGSWLETAVQVCRGWRARRDLTVSALTSQVDPLSSRLTVEATVRNAGRQPAVIGAARTTCCLASVESGEALTVPPGGQARARWSLWLPTCDAVSAAVTGGAQAALDPLTTDQVGLAALAGPALPSDLTMFQPASGPFSEQLNPTGVVLAPDAAAALTDGLRRACGGLSLPVLLLPRGAVRLDLGAGRIQVDGVLDVSPGRVRSVLVTAEAADPRAEDFRPTWTALGPFTPDLSGQVPLRLTYRITGPRRPCLDPLGGVPGFLITLEVPEGATTRTLRYGGAPALEQDPAAVARFCVNP